jgi:hypothetical protein
MVTDRRTWGNAVFCHDHLKGHRCPIPIYLPAIMAQPIRMASMSAKTEILQTARPDLLPKFHLIWCDCPILQFHLASTECGEILKSMHGELPFLAFICSSLKSSLKGDNHGHHISLVCICLHRPVRQTNTFFMHLLRVSISCWWFPLRWMKCSFNSRWLAALVSSFLACQALMSSNADICLFCLFQLLNS